jgi:hypothetical protein
MTRVLHRLGHLTFAVLLAVQLLVLTAPAARAQFFDESLEQDDLFVEDEDQLFQERTFEEQNQPGGSSGPTSTGEQDFSEGGGFVDEQSVPLDRRIPSTSSRRLQLSLGKERDVLPLNVAWGAGTGLLIGGWFALIGQGDNRETQRSIGLGIVTGIVLGFAVGTRSLFQPNAPKPGSISDATPPASDPPKLTPVVALDPAKPQVGFRLTF